MSTPIVDEAAKVFADPTSYADEARPLLATAKVDDFAHAQLDVGRDPNKHLAFGYGAHCCLGAALARTEVNSFFAELLPRLKSIELNGNPELIATTFVGGLKHLPIRYELC
jgi:cytochrome P450